MDRIPNFILGNVDNQPLSDNIADLITLEGTPIRDNTPSEIARIVKPGGMIILVNPEGEFNLNMHKQVIDTVGGTVLIDRKVLPVEGYKHSGQYLTTVIIAPR